MNDTSGNRASRALFIASAIFLALLLAATYGYRTGKGQTAASFEVNTLLVHLESLRRHGRWAPAGLYADKPINTPDAVYTVHDPERMVPGYRAVMLWDDSLWNYAIHLYDTEHQRVHTWVVDYTALDPAGANAIIPINPHGMAILPDASVLVNFGMGANRMARLDSCSEPVWVREGLFHHSIELDGDNAAWTWEAERNTGGPLQWMVRFDVDSGATDTRIDLMELARRSDQDAAVLAGTGQRFVYPGERKRYPYPRGSKDVFHPNDVEALPASLADAFPGFEAGDLLISLRNRNLVAVLSPGGELRWWRHGLWVEQHDPDFGADGRIYVYNNNPPRERSSIIAIDPNTDSVEQLYADGSPHFYSKTQGKHQLLPRRQHQVVIPAEGRVIEATRRGKLVFEYINLAGERAVGRVLNANWLPPDFFQSPFPDCDAT